MRYVAQIGERRLAISLEEHGRERRVSLEGRELAVEWNAAGAANSLTARPDDFAAHYGILAGTHSYDVYVRPLEGDEAATDGAADGAADGGRVFEVTVGGRAHRVIIRDERAQALAGLAGGAHISGDAAIRAPMPGLVSNVLAQEGAAVERGQTIIVLEAMKMENDLTTPRPGIVKALRAQQGQTVNQGDVLAIVGDAEGTQPPPSEDDDGDA